ncbi:MAG: carboxylating nicotinate-nucleotide diphosphorylase [Methanoregulaceae archaeon]|nr:carboxylating nicotinate-nucleotide diphosphorylase [Methanoregulaceae archaeon]
MTEIGKLLSFLDEDAPFGDITSRAVVPRQKCSAAIIARQAGIAAGLEEAEALFIHHGVAVTRDAVDGDPVTPGTRLLSLSGEAEAVLLVERTAENIIGRMSGIATETRSLLELIRSVSPSCRVAATRKTCPGLRWLDKKAVAIGGGEQHRFSLSDAVIVKNTHLAFVSIEEAITLVNASGSYHKIEVEVGSVVDAVRAARGGADIIMFDNMAPEQVRMAILAISSEGLREHILLEASGGIDRENIRTYASLGVDFISMGTLTHSVRNFDVHLEIQKVG